MVAVEEGGLGGENLLIKYNKKMEGAHKVGMEEDDVAKDNDGPRLIERVCKVKPLIDIGDLTVDLGELCIRHIAPLDSLQPRPRHLHLCRLQYLSGLLQ